MSMMIYNFNHEDTMLAVTMGQQQSQASRLKNRKDNHGLINDDPVADARRQTIGFLGELAVCRLFGQDLELRPYVFGAPDLVVNDWSIEVKSSENPKSLIIRPNADDFHAYVLCEVHIPDGDPRVWHLQERLLASTVTILGWCFPYYARLWAEGEPSLWKSPGGRAAAIFLPADWLCDIESLISLTQAHPSEYDMR